LKNTKEATSAVRFINSFRNFDCLSDVIDARKST